MPRDIAIYCPLDGVAHEVMPKNGKSFTYEELKSFVGYPVQMVPLPDGRTMVINEEGKLTGLAKNEVATAEWKRLYPIAEYPINNDELVVGNALFSPEKYLGEDEE